MYTPGYSRMRDRSIIRSFVERHSFGMLCTAAGRSLEVNHLPFLPDWSRDGEGVLWTHLALANPQGQALAESASGLVVLQGPHSYVSPSMYVEPLNVPTWNYAVVHAHCSARIIREPVEIESILERTVHHFEQASPTPWRYHLPKEFRESLVKAIVGVELRVERWEAKFKLSQNRSPVDFDSVLGAFARREDPAGRELHELMESVAGSRGASKDR